MSSLRQILHEFAPVLLLDAASSRIQAGWFENAEGKSVWATSSHEAGIGVFECLQKLDVDPKQANAFLFCEGPGSILGIRTIAVAIRTWNVSKTRAVFAYQSLRVIAASPVGTNVTVIADARRDSWHTLANANSALARVPTAELAGLLVTPEGFRNWTPLPPGTRSVPYQLGDQLDQLMDADIFRRTDAPDAFLHEEPAYLKWTPKIHRAP